MIITEMVLENFKSYAGIQRIGPFHKASRAFHRVPLKALRQAFLRCGHPACFPHPCANIQPGYEGDIRVSSTQFVLGSC